MAQFEAHGVGHQNPPEETRKAFDLADFDQITERSSIGDDDLHSETKLIEGLLLKLKIGHGVVLVNSARLEKAVEFAAGLKPEGATQLSLDRTRRPRAKSEPIGKRSPSHRCAKPPVDGDFLPGDGTAGVGGEHHRDHGHGDPI